MPGVTCSSRRGPHGLRGSWCSRLKGTGCPSCLEPGTRAAAPTEPGALGHGSFWDLVAPGAALGGARSKCPGCSILPVFVRTLGQRQPGPSPNLSC